MQGRAKIRAIALWISDQARERDKVMTTGDDNQTQGAGEVRAMSGRERVRELVIRPLQADGLVRANGATVADHEAFEAWMAEKLAYLSPANLTMMRLFLRAHATGPAKNVWPCKATVLNHAHDLQAPPDTENPIMQSWLHSRAGEAALAKGVHVETYLFLKGLVMKGRPRAPLEADQKLIKRRAEDNRRRRELIQEKIDAGRHVLEDDRGWFYWYQDQAKIAEDIVRAGIAHRRSQAEVEDAA